MDTQKRPSPKTSSGKETPGFLVVIRIDAMSPIPVPQCGLGTLAERPVAGTVTLITAACAVCPKLGPTHLLLRRIPQREQTKHRRRTHVQQ